MPSGSTRRSACLASSLWFILSVCQAVKTDIDLYLNNPNLDSDADRAAQNIVYYGQYSVGTPGKRFLGCVDTGSADLWLPSVQCTSQVCRSHDRYNASASTTSTPTNTQSIIQYGTGSVAIQLAYDTITIGNLTVPNQGFGAATALTRDFSDVSCDGLIGLGFPSLSSTRTAPLVSNAISQNLLDSNTFGLWLNPLPGREPAGRLTLGGIDNTKYTGTIQNVAVSTLTYWQVPLTSTYVGSASLTLSPSSAVIDSGTTAIVASSADVQKLHQQIPGAKYWASEGVWNVTCNIKTLPNITFGLGSANFSLPPSLWVQALIDVNGKDLGACASSIVDGGSSKALNSYLVLGTNFLRAWYTTYTVNGKTAQVGFAPGAGRYTTQSASALSASGGRKLMNLRDEYYQGLEEADSQLFRRTVASFDQPKWGRVGPHNIVKETKDNKS